MSIEQIRREAMALPVEDRAALVGELWESVRRDADAAWVAEIERRIDELDRGDVEAVDGEDVFRQIEVMLAAMRKG
jgi:putative addiction module component (TIGR02574 family)